MKLAQLEAAFQAFVLDQDNDIRGQVNGTPRVDADTRLGIYANAYRLRLLEALATDYPGLKLLAGDDGFDRLGRAYIAAHPSHNPSLRWFGDRLGEFLRATPPWEDQPALAEMADFEWAMSDAFDAEDCTLVTVADMAAVPPEAWAGLGFTPHASVQRLDLRWNVPEVWKTATAGEAFDPPLPYPQPVGWLVWRKDLNTYFRSLDVDEAVALDALRRGASFAEICEALCEWVDAQHVAGHAAGLLKQWVEDGLIRGLRTT